MAHKWKAKWIWHKETREVNAHILVRKYFELEDVPAAALNLPYAERVVKMLLWQRGGWKVSVVKECGTCHKRRMPPKSAASSDSPPAAAHPITGGSAPQTAPTSVFKDVRVFSGV